MILFTWPYKDEAALLAALQNFLFPGTAEPDVWWWDADNDKWSDRPSNNWFLHPNWEGKEGVYALHYRYEKEQKHRALRVLLSDLVGVKLVEEKLRAGAAPVILESPYGGDEDTVTRNVAYARACMRDSLLRGESPFAAHLLYTQPDVLVDELPAERKLGIKAGFAWRPFAYTTVVYIDLGITPGMQEGIDDSLARGISVEHRSLEGWKDHGCS